MCYGLTLWKTHAVDLRRALAAFITPDRLGIASAALLLRAVIGWKAFFERRPKRFQENYPIVAGGGIRGNGSQDTIAGQDLSG